MADADDCLNIISMNRYRQSTSHPALTQVEAYWEALRKGRVMPTRAEIDPRGITGALEYTFLLERVARGIARFRLSGTHLADVMGMDVRGMPLTAIMTVEGRKQISDTLETMFEAPAAVRLELNAESGIGKPALAAQMILLPLRSDLGDVTRALGCLVTEGQIGRTPRRFAITTEERRSLTGFGNVPAAVARPEAGARVPGFADATRGDLGAARPYLRLVKTDD